MKLETEIKNTKISIQNEILNKDVALGTRSGHTDYEYQAKIYVDGAIKRHSLVGAFTFLDKDGNYLGIDRGFFELDGAPFRNPFYVDMSVSIPKGTASVECVLDYQQDRVEKWQIFLFVSASLILMILLSWFLSIWI